MTHFGNMLQFSSYEALADYCEVMLGKPLYGTDQTFNNWNDTFKYYMDNYTTCKYIRNSAGEIIGTEWEGAEILHDEAITAVGETVSVSSASSSSAAASASAVGGGGVKTIPKVQTVVTDTTTGGATPGSPAKGLKNFGADIKTPLINTISALTSAYGLANIAINVQNCDLWADFCNFVFNTNLDKTKAAEELLNDIKYTFSLQHHKMLIFADGEVKTVVPMSIAEKMFKFFADHIDEIDVPGGQLAPYLNSLIFNLVVFGDVESHIAPTPEYYARYKECLTNAAPNTGDAYFDIAEISDSLLKLQMTDFIGTIIGSGFEISDANKETLLNSTEGLTAAIQQAATNLGCSGDITDCNFVRIYYILERGSSAPPKTTPISLNEITIRFTLGYDPDITIETTEDRKRIHCRFAYAGGGIVNHGAKYLKRGRDGSNDDDYAYWCYVIKDGYSTTGFNCYKGQVTYPSNIAVVGLTDTYENTSYNNYNYALNGDIDGLYVNGYYADDHTSSVPDNGISGYYSTISYKGTGKSYTLDEYLSKGFVIANNDGTPIVLPSKQNKSQDIIGVYPTWAGKVKVLSQVDRTGDEKQTPYIPVSTPFGSNSAQKIIDHGTDPNSDPGAYRFPTGQNEAQSGKIPKNVPIDDVNEEIGKNIEDFNDSDVTPESAPDPIPATDPNPQYPVNPPTDPGGDSGETPDPTIMIGVTASGMCSVYNPTKEQLKNFSAWLWSPNFLDNFLKIFQNPMDAIIGLHIMYATPITGTPANIVCGYLDSGVSSKVVTQQFSEIDCGHVEIPEYYGNAIDYEPYTQVHVYLPFVGIVSLKPNDVIGKELYIKYGVDAMTGTCLAVLTTKKGNSEIACYNFPGNCACQIPISGGSYAQVISGLASMAVGVAAGAATANPLAIAGGVMAGVMSSHLDVAHGGTIGANAGAMGVRKPYVIITRKSGYEATGYNQFYGYPANKTVALSSCKGYTRVKSVHVEIPTATANEKNEIETLLKQGVIIR